MPPSEPTSCERAGSVREALGTAITDYLDVRLEAGLESTPVRPGDAATARVRLANGARTALRDVRATLTGLDAAWHVEPTEARLAGRLDERASAQGRFALTVPDAQRPGTVSARARVRYAFEHVDVAVETPFAIEVVSPIEVAAMRATPSPVRPGRTVEVTTTLRNTGRTAVTGRVQVGVPAGWTTPAPSEPVTVGAGSEVDVTTAVVVPRDAQQAVTDVTLEAVFTRDGTDLATGSTTLQVATRPAAGPGPRRL